ncbi:hypothetical protein GCM10019817_17470 [Lactobacillus intestinalis]
MTLRASLGMAIVLGAMGLVQNVWQLLILRILQSVFSRFVSNALIATETPKDKSGQALGSMMSFFTAGNLLGPFVGGTLASMFSYRITFFITGLLLLIAFSSHSSLFTRKASNQLRKRNSNPLAAL